MIHIIPGLPVTSNPQCKENRHNDAHLESFRAIRRFKPTFIGAHQASKIICKLWSLKSRIKTPSFSEEIIISSNEVIKDFETDRAVGIGKLGNPTREMAQSYVIVKQNADSEIFTLELKAKKSDL